MTERPLPESEGGAPVAKERLKRDYAISVCIGLSSFLAFMIVFLNQPLLYFYGLCGSEIRVFTVAGIAYGTGLVLHFLARQRYGTSYFRVFRNAVFPHWANDAPEAKDHRRLSYATVDMMFVGGLILSCLALLYHVNHTLDRSVAYEERVVVSDTFVQTNKNSHSYYAKFEVPGQKGRHSAVRVTKDEHASIVPGQTAIDLVIHEGGLGMPWIARSHVVLDVPPANITADTPRADDRNAYEAAAEWEAPLSERAMGEAQTVARQSWSNGREKQAEPMVNGQRHGMAQYWFDNGQSYAHIPWWRGEKHGRFKLYRANGTLEQNLSYRHGLPHGLNCWYDEQGRLAMKQVYIDGKALSYDGIQLPVCP